MWNLKKGHNELLCSTDNDSQALKNLWFPNETGYGGWVMCWGFGMEMLLKLGCDDCCTTINVIKFVE